MSLKETVSRHWLRFQRELFPLVEETVGPLGERYQRLVQVLELVRVEELLPSSRGWRGRPLEDRAALGAGFSGEGGAEPGDDPGVGGACGERAKAAPAMRLGEGGECAERVDLLAGLCGVYRHRPDPASARGAVEGDAGGALGGATCRGTRRRLRDGKASAQGGPGGEAEASAGPAAKGRATTQGVEPSPAAGVDDAGRRC